MQQQTDSAVATTRAEASREIQVLQQQLQERSLGYEKKSNHLRRAHEDALNSHKMERLQVQPA